MVLTKTMKCDIISISNEREVLSMTVIVIIELVAICMFPAYLIYKSEKRGVVK
jgi:hypothetical protein